MMTLRIEEGRVRRLLNESNFTAHQVNTILKIFEQVDNELTEEGRSG